MDPAPDKPEKVALDLTPEFIDYLASLGSLASGAPRDNKAIRAGLLGFATCASNLSRRPPNAGLENLLRRDDWALKC
jgi:hypothetical protein